MMRRAWLVVVGAAVIAPSCGSGTDPAPPATATVTFDVDGPFDAGQVADTLLTTVSTNADVAGVALLTAVDRGYEVPLVAGAVMADRLSVEGFVLADDGSLVVPDGPDAGVIIDKAPLPAVEEAGRAAVEIALVGYRRTAPIQVVTAAELGDHLRQWGDGDGGIGDAGNLMLRLIVEQLGRGFSVEQIVTSFVFGTPMECDTESIDVYCKLGGEPPDGPKIPSLLRDDAQQELYEREQTGLDPDSGDGESGVDQSGEGEADENQAPTQLLWEGEMSPIPDLVENPIAGSFEMTRTDDTDDFRIVLATTDAKTGTFTTDGFNEVECTAEWSSVFEGAGTFWDVNDLGIEFEGQITRHIVYVAGPCDSQLDPETTEFSGVVVFITEDGIELSFNAWTIAIAGPPPVPVTR